MEIDVNFEDISEQDGKRMLKNINDKSSKTLKKLALLHCKGTVFDELKNTFDSVKMIMLSTDKTDAIKFTTSTKKLNKLFKNLEQMSLTYLKNSEWEFLEGEFPLLADVHVIMPNSVLQNDRNLNESRIVEFLEQNTKVERVIIEFMTINLLQKISKCKAKFNEMHLNYFADNFLNVKLKNSDIIRFDGISKLSIISNNPLDEMHENIIFDELEQLVLTIRDDFNKNWITFIDKQVNKHLKIIIVEASRVEREDFLIIADMLPNLESVAVHSSALYKTDDIIEFLKRNDHLEEMYVECKMEEDELELLDQLLLKSNWMFEGNFDEEGVDIMIKRWVKR